MEKYVLVSLESGRIVTRFTEEKRSKIEDLYGFDDYYIQLESDYYEDLNCMTEKQALTLNNKIL